MKWPKSVEKVENGGRLGSPCKNFCPPPPTHTHTKRAAGSASDCWYRQLGRLVDSSDA